MACNQRVEKRLFYGILPWFAFEDSAVLSNIVLYNFHISRCLSNILSNTLLAKYMYIFCTVMIIQDLLLEIQMKLIFYKSHLYVFSSNEYTLLHTYLLLPITTCLSK